MTSSFHDNINPTSVYYSPWSHGTIIHIHRYLAPRQQMLNGCRPLSLIQVLTCKFIARFTLSTPMSPTSKDRLIADLEATSIRRPISTAAEKSAVRERALRRMMADLKKRISRTTKPQDWNVNYGKPRRGMRTVLNSSSR